MKKRHLLSTIIVLLFVTIFSISYAMDSSVYDSMRNRIISAYSTLGQTSYDIYIEVRDSSGNLIDPANLPNLNNNPETVVQNADESFSLSYNEAIATAYISYTNPSSGHDVAVVDLSPGSGGGGDTEPPTVPTGLTATAVSTSQINLSWNASSDNIGVTGYKVYKDGAYFKSVQTTSTWAAGLLPSTQYCFTVSAFDAAGNESAQSNQACATTHGSGGGGGNIDLQPTYFYTGSTLIYRNGEKQFDYKVKNNGTDASGSYVIKIYLSKDNHNISEDDYLLKTITATSLPGGAETSVQSITVTNPSNLTIHGTYYYIIKVDANNQISETNENNNELYRYGTVKS